MLTNSEIIRASYAALLQDDLDSALANFAPGIEWTYPEGLGDHGLGGTRKGHAGVREFLARAQAVFGELRSVPEEFLESGDQVVVFGVHRIRGAATGGYGTVPFVHSWRLADGQATHFVDYHDTAAMPRIMEGEFPPPGWLLQTNADDIRARTVHLAAELRLADLLADGPRSADELALDTATQPASLYRLLRTLGGFGIVTEAAGRFALTRLGAYLRTDHPQSVQALLAMRGLFSKAFAEADHSLRTGEPAFQRAYGLPLFTYLQQNSDKGAIFNAAMSELTQQMTRALLDGYDFGWAHHIVDIGGGDGTLLSAVLTAYPRATGTVFDQPHVLPAAQERISATGLTARCAAVAGDFFEEVPKGGDLYLLKDIIHDWQDEPSVKIFRTVRRAMNPSGRLLVIERVVPDGDDPDISKVVDFTMLVVTGGQERTRQEYADLLAEAGLRLTRVIDTPVGTSNILEAVLDDSP
jgi:ketosteroid isomerase-like protein